MPQLELSYCPPIDYNNISLQDLSLRLFDALIEMHRLPAKTRRVLELAAAFYQQASEIDAEHAYRIGRDLALAAPMGDQGPSEQALVASVVAFQRDSVRPEQEPTFLCLDEKDQPTTLQLAALLQIADAISSWPDAELHTISVSHGKAILLLDGIDVSETIAKERSTFWRATLGSIVIDTAEQGEIAENDLFPTTPLASEPEQFAIDVRIPPIQAHAVQRLSGSEPIAEGARRVLRRLLDKLLARESDIRHGEDPEHVHQMRVATRRLRAALQIVEGVYERELIQRYRRGLRRIAKSLGGVRDGDVFLEHICAYGDALPAEERARLDPLVAAVVTERARARRALLEDLDSRKYNAFKHAFAGFLCTPGAGALDAPEPGITQRVRDFAGSAIWRRYELWRAYEVALPDAAEATLHQARIAGKRLRYALEFFGDALGPSVGQVLSPLVELQECLGALQDVVTARAHIAALGMEDHPGTQAYLAARDIERVALLAELPRRWELVGSAAYWRELSELLVKL